MARQKLSLKMATPNLFTTRFAPVFPFSCLWSMCGDRIRAETRAKTPRYESAYDAALFGDNAH